MAEGFQFELVSPEQLLVSTEVSEVVVPGADGYFTVLANHAPTMSTLQPGVAEVKQTDGQADKYVVFGGFVDVTPEACTVLAESAVRVSDIDRSDLEQRIQDAREDLDDAKDDDSRSKAQAYLDQLTTLQGAILPA
ncbi:F0F1 ATP synthase subunit epsilon [Roseitalea porphyridii]|uniref:ATP synthase epsilon chain n=1 Tax=Roseitalea porphyridii TaxID=1852022 RepID=A0A4P6V457_9HYPH|nr:F0F1 ATP synthase subunit epsilon [Roseitalea porphyridii]QBK32045.1 F0F1 ATP synthase subunit epsilon [Roseitalea porphyridii]